MNNTIIFIFFIIYFALGHFLLDTYFYDFFNYYKKKYSWDNEEEKENLLKIFMMIFFPLTFLYILLYEILFFLFNDDILSGFISIIIIGYLIHPYIIFIYNTLNKILF